MTTDPAILFFDIDGTLTVFDPVEGTDKDPTGPVPSPALQEAFHQLRAAGHIPLICSGRPQWLIGDNVRCLDVAGFVLNGGASIEVDGELLFEEKLDDELIVELAQRALKTKGTLLFELNSASITFFAPEAEGVIFPKSAIANSVEELVELGGLGTCKVCMDEDTAREIDGDDGFVAKNFTSCKTGGGREELSPLGIDKGHGVRKAIEHFGMDGKTSYGFGDSGNDIGMLEAVDVAVAMGNSMPEVFDVADYITDNVEDDGVVTALVHFGLIEAPESLAKKSKETPAEQGEPAQADDETAAAAVQTSAPAPKAEAKAKVAPRDPFLRAENEDDDGYDPYSDRRPEREPLFERDPWA